MVYVGYLPTTHMNPDFMENYLVAQPMSIDFSKARFLKSAPSLGTAPKDCGIEVAFVGRSNAGKSSALNVIANQNKLARTSKTPGRTQLMNFFELDPDRRIVDLPGYGYAKIPDKVKRQIEEILGDYLSARQCLHGLVLVMDIRHPLTPRDLDLINFATDCEQPVHILLTKCDKLKRGASNNTLLEVRRKLNGFKGVTAQTFSATRQLGLEEAKQKLTDWFTF